ncbi:MAG TPA: molybdenum cofactor guanylyltransferase [Chromatiales bacterium]|nr:molybdenum cofactor guanylyltransferase [Thiotrichales bacterium]HIP68844.1 molybdenum cofactor guanylyltransferase [Chromatiales bacterium]
MTAVILAGGQGRRMGGKDKGLLAWGGRPLIETILDTIKPQVGHILINANRNKEKYTNYGYPVVADNLDGYQGPLAGFVAGMKAAKTDYITTIPCDSPLIPADMFERLSAALIDEQAELAVAHDGQRLQPVYALLPVKLLDSLLQFMGEGNRKIDLWYARHKMAVADFSDKPEIFRNVNTPEQHSELHAEVVG